jgi:hypothetical protein
MRIRLKPGTESKAKVQVTGAGPNLDLPSSLGLELPVTVQLQSSDRQCWGATYFAAGVVKNDATRFKARAGSPGAAFLDRMSGLLE